MGSGKPSVLIWVDHAIVQTYEYGQSPAIVVVLPFEILLVFVGA